MPRALEPGVLFPVVLPGDMNKTPAPTFIVKALSVRAQQRLVAGVARVQKEAGNPESYEGILQELGSLVVSWKNMVDPETGGELAFSPSKLGELLTLVELMQLVNLIIGGCSLTEDERKKFESPHS